MSSVSTKIGEAQDEVSEYQSNLPCSLLRDVLQAVSIRLPSFFLLRDIDNRAHFAPCSAAHLYLPSPNPLRGQSTLPLTILPRDDARADLPLDTRTSTLTLNRDPSSVPSVKTAAIAPTAFGNAIYTIYLALDVLALNRKINYRAG